MSATITMGLGEYQELHDAKKKAENEIVELQKQLVDAKLSDADVRKLVEFGRNALAVARFAVENLPPETIKNWPYEKLTRVSELLVTLPDCSLDDQSLAIELRNFADECRRIERGRKSGMGQQNLQSAG